MTIQRWVTVTAALAALPALCLPAAGPAVAAPPATPREHVHVAKPPAHHIDLDAARPQSAGMRQRDAAAQATALPRDVTGDGRADAVVRDPGAGSGGLRVYAHNGSTTSNPWTSFVSAGGQWDFADVLLIGDVTGDGLPDVVTRDPVTANGSLWVYPHNGSTTGTPWTSRTAAGTGWNTVNTILLGDLTGDGLPDLVAREPGLASGTLWIYPHNGATTGNPWTVPKVWAGTGWNLANTMALDDVTGDGHPDVVVRDGGGALWVYPHNGTTNGNPYTSRFGAGTGWGFANAILATDATGDGKADIVARDDTGALWVYPHNGSTGGNPYTVSRFSAGGGWNFANALLTGDVTGDGRPDILARVHGGDLWVYPNDGTPDGGPWTSRFPAGSRWAFENAMLLGDVTGDGRPEVIARDPAATDGTLWVYPNNGATTSDPWTMPRAFAGTGWNLATAMMLGDLTGDGWADIVARDRKGDLWVYPHTGSATGNHWTVRRVWAGTGWNTAAALALGDVSGDGVPDLVDKEQDGSMWIYATGSSGAPIRVAGDWRSTDAIALGDVDGTGRLDLVARDTSGALWIHPHDGSSGANPWTSRRSAGTDWAFASALLL